MLRSSSDVEVRTTDYTSTFTTECTVPDDWLKSVTVNVYKGTGDVLKHGNYRSQKFLYQIMALAEKVWKSRISCKMDTDAMQYGFVPGSGKSDVILIQTSPWQAPGKGPAAVLCVCLPGKGFELGAQRWSIQALYHPVWNMVLIMCGVGRGLYPHNTYEKTELNAICPINSQCSLSCYLLFCYFHGHHIFKLKNCMPPPPCVALLLMISYSLSWLSYLSFLS